MGSQAEGAYESEGPEGMSLTREQLDERRQEERTRGPGLQSREGGVGCREVHNEMSHP